MEYTKENLKELSLVEIKQICKRYGLRRTGSKTVLINSIVKYTTEPEVTVSLPTEYKPSPGKKVVGVIMGDHEKSVQLGKLREKNKVKTLYYSMGVHYYEVDKEFKFM